MEPTQPFIQWAPWFFFGGKATGDVKLSNRLHLMSKLRRSGAILLLLLHAFMARTATILPFSWLGI